MIPKFILATAALASAAMASNTTGPYTLQVTGKQDTSIAGFVGACHAGAAIEGMCYVSGTVNASDSYYQFYFDYGGYDPTTGEVFQPGWLSWLLHYQDQNGDPATQPSPLDLSPGGWGTNVMPGLFTPSQTYTYVGFDDDGRVYMSGGYDDSAFNATRPSPVPSLGNLYNWHLCYQYTGGYYYQSVSWVLTDPPHNPSCQPIDLTLQLVDE